MEFYASLSPRIVSRLVEDTDKYKYIIDSYEVYAASALVYVTLIRYVAAGGMTIAGIPFYENMSVHWTLTILGGISALMVPVPYVFHKYGRWIRSKSK